MNIGHVRAASACLALLFGLLFLSSPVAAQQDQNAPAVPADRSALSAGRSDPGAGLRDEPPAGDDRIFKVMPNYETVQDAPNVQPLSPSEKFKLTAEDSFDPFQFVLVGVLAGASQAENSEPTYGQGAAGYAKRYAANLANQTIGNFLTGAVLPTLLHEDPRYFELGKGSFGHRFGYALSRVFITPTDSGRLEFNYSEFAGNAAAAGIANAYSSPQDRTAANTSVNFTEQLAIDMLNNELREFWPDIHRKLFHKP